MLVGAGSFRIFIKLVRGHVMKILTLRHFCVGMFTSMVVFTGCESPGDLFDSDDDKTTEAAASTADGSEPAATANVSVPGSVDLGNVNWLHANVSGWAQTANLSSVSVNGGSITLAYNKANVWPGANAGGANVNANPWIFVFQDGRWHAATWEWLRVGQITKSTGAVNGNHIKQAPLTGFSPRSGEVYGFMVSGLARDSTRNVQERSNIVMVRWP